MLSNGGHGGKAWWIFEKTPPNSGGMAGCEWRRHGGHDGYGGMAENSGFLGFIFAIGVGLTRPNPTRYFVQKRSPTTMDSTERSPSHATQLRPRTQPQPCTQKAAQQRRPCVPSARPRRTATATATVLQSATDSNVVLFLFSFFCCCNFIIFIIFNR